MPSSAPRTQLVVAGEALVDLIADPGQAGTFHAREGGAPYNASVAASRLGVATAWLGRLSDDGFGVLLGDRLRAEGVDTGLAATGGEPTSLAVAQLDDDGRATYAFYLDGTTNRSYLAEDLPMLPQGAALAVTFGAIGLDDEPMGQALSVLVRREAGRRLVTLDPNVRPSAVADRHAYRRALDDLVASVAVVKTSDEDLELLGLDAFEHAAGWVAGSDGPALVVMTRGPDGATAFHARHGRVDVPGVSVDVVDTVGAGDTFGAGLQAWLVEHDVRDRAGVAALASDEVHDALAMAVRAGALACTRRGADPPTRSELDAFSP